MRKLTVTLMAGAAAVVAAGSASAANPPTLAGTYLQNSVLENANCFGQPAGTETVGSNVFNFAGFGKTGDYSNTMILPPGSSAFGGGALNAFSTITGSVPTAHPTSWVGTETLTIRGPGLGSGVTYATETFTSTNTWLDKNAFIEDQSSSGGCTSAISLVRVGK